MRYLKALGLAAVATMALTGLLGANSASGTVLCTTTSTPCGPAWHIDAASLSLKAGTTFVTKSTGGGIETTCGSSTMSATKSVTRGETATAVFTVPRSGLTWSTCNVTTDTLEGGELEVHQISGTDNGEVTGKGFRVTRVIDGFTCIFRVGANSALGTLTGGPEPVLEFHAVMVTEFGTFFCPAESVWDGQFIITNHTEAYVESA